MNDDYTEVLNYIQPEGYGVIYLYVFDDEDIYVGQTTRSLRNRHMQHQKGRFQVDR